MQSQQSIPLNRLVQSPDNVRRTGRMEGVEALMASIAAHGLRQNLNVLPTEDGRFAVIAGGRRLVALKKLARAGVVAVDMPVPCLVLTGNESATEISLVENALQQPMHPDDQFTAFHALVEQGLTEHDVAARFGVTPAVVQQRLRLARVSPAIRAAYRHGRLNLEQVMAYALGDGHGTQEAAWRALGDDAHPHTIRRALTAETVRPTAQLAQYVGLDAYLAAGGGILRDLFDEGQSYLTDPALLTALAQAQLAAAAEAVQAEGWAWVSAELEPDYQTGYGRVPAEEDEAGVPVYSPTAMRQAGAVLRIEYDGSVSVRRGLVRRSETPAGDTGPVPASRPKDDFAGSTVTELSAHRTMALQLALSLRPDVALAAVVYTLTAYGTGSTVLMLGGTRCQPHAAIPNPEEGPALAEVARMVDGWGDVLPGNPGDLWTWCLGSSQTTLLELLATIAGASVNAVQRKDEYGAAARLAEADRLAAALDLDMAQWWQPSAEGFYGRLSKATLAKALTEAGQPGAAADFGMMKKAAAVTRTAQALAGTGWLPAPLRPASETANDNRPEMDEAA